MSAAGFRLCVVFTLITASAIAPAWSQSPQAATVAPSNSRRPANDDELRYWLENMVWYHGFTPDEITAATGLDATVITAAVDKWNIRADTRPTRTPDQPLLLLPYPGGRHPRIGFLDGAVAPQRETKVSVFTPWDMTSYVVVDVPEAIWSNLGLTYLAHTHVETIWERQHQSLPPLEWHREPAGALVLERVLPNGIEFGSRVVPHLDHIEMKMWLKNGTAETLSDLRVQNCVMLKGAAGFTAQTNDNNRFVAPFAVCHDETGKRWVITAWEPIHRVWGNERCPCLHADPKFPDCEPGDTQVLRGWLSFYEGDGIDEELARIRKRFFVPAP